jgi:predicted PurR-regulated permease PerM
MPEADETRKPREISRLIELAYAVVIFCLCSWAREFLLPVILAALISFLLAPLVLRLERLGFHSILAVFTVVAVTVAVLGIVCMTVSIETLDLANSLPKYRENIHARWAAIQKGPPGPMNIAFRNLDELVNDLTKRTPSDDASRHQFEPMKVQIVGGTDGMLAMARSGMTPMMASVASFAVVVVLVVFMLLERKRLRHRFLRLIGQSHVVTTTLAVDEAGSRLSRFLLVQLQVNAAYAIVLGIGLTWIGIPNAILWAILTLALRFLPYVGLWISAFFPLALSIAISTSWKEPVLTLLLYTFLELFTNNFIEPVVLGGSTGVSPLGVIVSALFWTWLWGPVGLLLATPLTACLVVLGRYFRAFHFWSVLLATDPPTSAETNLIRLLIESRLPEAKAMVHGLTGNVLSIQTAENLILATIRTIENDIYPGGSATQSKAHLYEQMREIIDELKVKPSEAQGNVDKEQKKEPDNPQVVIVPFTGEGDEIVGRVLAQLLAAEGTATEVLSWRILRAEKIEQLRETQAKCILLSAVEARSALSIGKMARSIKEILPEALILVGLWSLPPRGGARIIRKISESPVGSVYTSLEQAIRGIASVVLTVSEEPESIRLERARKTVP